MFILDQEELKLHFKALKSKQNKTESLKVVSCISANARRSSYTLMIKI